jgi:hypothetical protein
MEEQQEYQFYPRLEGSIRKNKRLMEHEAKCLSRKLSDVEVLMAHAVQSDIWTSYKDSYDIHLEAYQAVLSTMNPKYIIVNNFYFKNLYKPIDTKNISPFIADLHALARILLGTIEESLD